MRGLGGGGAAVSAVVRHGGAVHRIVLEQVGVVFGGRTLFSGIDLAVAAGRCTAVVGPSGVGKTTLLRLLNRLSEPSEGRILLDGVPIHELEVLELRRRVGLVPQQPVLLTDVVVDEIRVGRPTLTDEEVRALLHRVGLAETFLHRRCAELSGGEAQRVCLARALAVAPEVLLLDEPTSALDEAAAAVIGDVVRDHCRAGGTAVLVSHDSIFTGTVADDILLLEGGHLAPLGSLDVTPPASYTTTPPTEEQSPEPPPGETRSPDTATPSQESALPQQDSPTSQHVPVAPPRGSGVPPRDSPVLPQDQAESVQRPAVPPRGQSQPPQGPVAPPHQQAVPPQNPPTSLHEWAVPSPSRPAQSPGPANAPSGPPASPPGRRFSPSAPPVPPPGQRVSSQAPPVPSRGEVVPPQGPSVPPQNPALPPQSQPALSSQGPAELPQNPPNPQGWAVPPQGGPVGPQGPASQPQGPARSSKGRFGKWWRRNSGGKSAVPPPDSAGPQQGWQGLRQAPTAGGTTPPAQGPSQGWPGAALSPTPDGASTMPPFGPTGPQGPQGPARPPTAGETPTRPPSAPMGPHHGQPNEFQPPVPGGPRPSPQRSSRAPQRDSARSSQDPVGPTPGWPGAALSPTAGEAPAAPPSGPVGPHDQRGGPWPPTVDGTNAVPPAGSAGPQDERGGTWPGADLSPTARGETAEPQGNSWPGRGEAGSLDQDGAASPVPGSPVGGDEGRARGGEGRSAAVSSGTEGRQHAPGQDDSAAETVGGSSVAPQEVAGSQRSAKAMDREDAAEDAERAAGSSGAGVPWDRSGGGRPGEVGETPSGSGRAPWDRTGGR
ncbi:ABC transporter ATP-binding protein [Nocardia blacklockiae]|uniref:ABC transporter ATP-binding protein n=1 Tax=Nocardia blacklockiae TaxID=480036 RepID=UPI001E42AE93|nr:ATP-binding cassette domain-containing protein [Nocardia blacklockiae]